MYRRTSRLASVSISTVAMAFVLPLAGFFLFDWFPQPCEMLASAGQQSGVAKAVKALFPSAQACGGGGVGGGGGGGSGDQCTPELTLADCSVSTDSKQKAQTILDYHTQGKLLLKEGTTDCTGSPNAKQSIEAIAVGRCATTCPNYACHDPTSVSPSLLEGMKNIADAAPHRPRITSVTGDKHEKNSRHYYGRAFDMGCQQSTDPWSCSSTHEAVINRASGELVTCALHNAGTPAAHFHCSRSTF